jgi:hypothetical protein
MSQGQSIFTVRKISRIVHFQPATGLRKGTVLRLDYFLFFIKQLRPSISALPNFFSENLR